MSRGSLFRAALARLREPVEASIRAKQLQAQRRKVAKQSSPEWEALRDAIGCCVCCGATENLTKDHILAVMNGGTNVIENLQPLCQGCNVEKGTRRIDYRPHNWRQLLASGRSPDTGTPTPEGA